MSKLIFITGIDTGVGKTYATGLIAKGLINMGFKTITMKPIQTGCDNFSEDIIEHRKLSGSELTPYDLDKITSPYIFKYPASPHLSAKLENKKIDINVIVKNIELLQNNFDYILIEGAGGLMVPINDSFLMIDLIKKINADTILVSTPKLGSINHTLLSIEALTSRNIKIIAILYNLFYNLGQTITDNTLDTIKQFHRGIPIFKFFKEIEDPFFSVISNHKKVTI
ncbi:MAG: dethiobiotin synthase [Calditerrivibrio sp.]|uniref:dethiobiotin synthase n=1 Tax=Calditerrivibrio sp. TaxID=2792612 RepID=UPI003D145A4D